MSDFFDDIISEVSETPKTNTLGPSEIPQTPQVEKVFSVAEFSMVLKEILEGAFKKIKIKGEIQGLKRHSSGTYYFDLKENYGGKDYILNCVLWKWTKIDVKLEEGLEVVIGGKSLSR